MLFGSLKNYLLYKILFGGSVIALGILILFINYDKPQPHAIVDENTGEIRIEDNQLEPVELVKKIEPKKEQVEEMIEGVQKVTKMCFERI